MKLDPQTIHAALDIETLSLRPNAVILSIGIQFFTFGDTTLLGDPVTFYPSVSEQLAQGRHIDPSTVDWWRQQSDVARLVFDTQRASLVAVQADMVRVLEAAGHNGGVWGFGSDVDNAKVEDMFRTAGLSCPWHYRANRCGRTLLGLVYPKPKDIVWPVAGNAHTAAGDARSQAAAFAVAGIKLGCN